MCRKLLFLLVALALCPLATASDVAISTEISWIGQAAADREAQEIADNVTGGDVQIFPTAQGAELATWVQDHTNDGVPDILILFGRFPTSIYPGANAQPDGSIAENFLDDGDGNCIVNTADWMFYVSNGGNNGAAGLQNMMDAPAATMDGAGENIQQIITADGQLYTPSLTALQTDRPFHLDTLTADWEVELLLAQDSTGNLVDPVIVHNTVTNGRIGIFYQTAGQDNDPRGEVMSEWINNWFMKFVATGNPYARRPDPADGSEIMQTYETLYWTKGDFAESHDVYVGTDEAAVTNANTGSPEYQGNKTNTFFVVGIPGFAIPEGLQPGTTYYWRIDEVKAGDPNSPWKGKTWSFSLPAVEATNPSPANEMGLIGLNANLSWKPGWGANLHNVYLSTDYDQVANATEVTNEFGESVGQASWDPGPLQPNTTYYWRVDEVVLAPPAVHVGEVWSFTTESGKPGGLLGEYYSFPQAGQPANPWVTFHISRVDPEIDFNWYVDDTTPGVDSPDPSIPVNGFSVRWTGEITIPKTDTYTFYGASDDGMRIYVGETLVMDAWVDRGRAETSGDITLEAGVYPIEVHYYENGGGSSVTLSWSSDHIAKAVVPEKALSPPVKAGSPRPAHASVDVNRMTDLEWNAGQYAASHDVYFGTDATAVANATKASPEFKGTQLLGNETYDPGTLALAQTYYWRIDEVNATNPDSPWVGHVWSFTVGDFITVDDIEDYNNFQPDRVFETWIDGWGNNSNGSIIGYPDPDFDAGESFVETGIVHGGDQSMPFYYENNMKYSEATRTLPAGLRDWTQEGVKALSMWYIGYAATLGSFVEGPAGAYTMTGAGSDIWDSEDHFHYAYKMLQGTGSMTARVDSFVRASNLWAKGGIMIRETLDPNSTNAFALVSTESSRARMQIRPSPAAASTGAGDALNITIAPHWIKLERDISGNFTASHANDVGGSPDVWTSLDTQNVQMAGNVYIGLAVTSHAAGEQATVGFSNITTTGTVTGSWTNTDIGIQSNAPESMYVKIKDAAGQTATAYNPDAAAANVTGWTEWGDLGEGIALSEFTAQNPSLNLSNIDALSIGFGTPGNTQPGGGGLMFFDDIRLYKPRCVPTLAKPALDFNNDCLVSMPDLEVLTDNWLISNYEVTPTAPSTSGLVAHYQFENNLLDSSGNGNNGTATGTPAYAAGQAGQAINLGGAASVTAGNIGVTGAAPRTIAGWAKASVPASSIAAWTNVFGLSGASASYRHFDIQAVGDTGATTWGYYGIHIYSGEDNIIPIDQDWHHLAATYDGTTITGYADGHKTGSFDQALDTEGVMQIGQRGDNANMFNGMVDDVRVYSRALSQGEIASLAGKTAVFTQDVGLITTIQDGNMDANADGTINFQDYAIMIDSWLDEVLWP